MLRSHLLVIFVILVDLVIALPSFHLRNILLPAFFFFFFNVIKAS